MSQDRPWLRRRDPEAGALDSQFVAYWTLVGAFIVYSSFLLLRLAAYYLTSPSDLFADAGLYFQATDAWLAGGNPWAVARSHGVAFAGPPTTLILNLPLVPFGSWVAPWFWAFAGLAAWLLVIRRLRLGPWWILFPPFVEAWAAGSPDPVLAGLILLEAGAISAFAKPYALPALLAEGRWRSAAAAGVAALITAPLLPWGRFVAELARVQGALADWSINSSAWGEPLLLTATLVALLVLGPRLGLLMATPGLWPAAQLHYSIFSAPVGTLSAFLALALAIPHAAPYGIIAYALYTKAGPLVVQRWRHRETAGVGSEGPGS